MDDWEIMTMGGNTVSYTDTLTQLHDLLIQIQSHGQTTDELFTRVYALLLKEIEFNSLRLQKDINELTPKKTGTLKPV